MIRLKNISFAAGSKNILNNVDLEFRQGKTNLILGANGAGKSSLMKIISGLTSNFLGEVTYDKLNVRSSSPLALARVRAVLSQSMDLSFNINVSDLVLMGRHPHFRNIPSAEDLRICEEAMQWSDVLEFKDRIFNSLSGGEKQRVLIARAIAQISGARTTHPHYLLLDEPLTFLDIQHQVEIMSRLSERIRETNGVLIAVIHDLNIAARFGDYIVLLSGGAVYASGAAEVVLTSENIKHVFGLECEISRSKKGLHILY